MTVTELTDAEVVSRAQSPEVAALVAAADPDELLDTTGVAEWLTLLRGRSTVPATVRGYRRSAAAGFPIPDEQIGGRDPEPGELVRSWPGWRLPRPGEKIGARPVRWKRSTITEWNAGRPGRGATRASREARAIDRAVRYPEQDWWRERDGAAPAAAPAAVPDA